MNKVIVLGSINMDIVAFTKHHPKNGETVRGTELKYFPGGKGANQAIASKKLGAETLFVSKIGDDSFGETIMQFLRGQDMKMHVTKSKNIPTGVGIITVAAETGDNTIVALSGANFDITKNEIADIKINSGDVLVGQFEVPMEVTEEFFKRGREVSTINILNAAPAQLIPVSLFPLIDILIINETELQIISGKSIHIDDIGSIRNAVQEIKSEKLDVIVTLGERGVVGFISNEIVVLPGRKVKAVDTTGAGDCFVGAVASQISKGISLVDVVKFANIAASISVTKEGAGPSMPTLAEVNKFL